MDPPIRTEMPPYRGERLDSETVLLYAEQGFGDTLQFCRFVPLVAAAGGRVLLALHRPMLRALSSREGVTWLRC